MSIWSKIDNFFAPKLVQREGTAAAAAAAADIPLYAMGLISRPERVKDLIRRVEKMQEMKPYEQAEVVIPLYLDLEAYIVENEPVRHYTKESLRLELYSVLNLKKSTLPFVGFFTPEIAGGVLLLQELFSKWVDPALEVLGTKKVEEIILSTLEGTVFDGLEYKNGVLDFSLIQSRLEHNNPSDEEFKKVFNKVSDAIVKPVIELRGTTPSIYLLRKTILNEWRLLHVSNQPAWQEQKTIIPITTKAREMIFSIGMDELITRGALTGIETELMTKSGKAKPVSVTASTLKDETGSIKGMVIAAKDLSEVRRLEAEKVRILENAKAGAEAEVAQRTQELEKSKAELENTVGRLSASEQQQKAAIQQLNAANQQLAAAQKNLQDKLLELERFNKVAVGRELRMVELKEELARLKGASAKRGK
jgi:hypothetical protein